MIICLSAFYACDPADDPVYEEGYQYRFNVVQTDADRDTVLQDTFLLKPRTSLMTWMFGHKQASWHQENNIRQKPLVINLFDNEDRLNILVPNQTSDFSHDPALPDPNISLPPDNWQELTVERGRVASGEEVKLTYENAGEEPCPLPEYDNENCVLVLGKQESDENGNVESKAWYHSEKGFLKWTYLFHPNGEEITFSLISAEEIEEE